MKQFTLDGVCHFEIAKILDITPKASYKRLERIQRKLEDVSPDF